MMDFEFLKSVKPLEEVQSPKVGFLGFFIIIISN